MKTSREFICLSYKNTDYLIEKSDVSGSLYESEQQLNFSHKTQASEKNNSAIDFDCLIAKDFNDSGLSGEKMIIRIGKVFIETTALAFVKTIPLSELRLFGNMMDEYFHKKGLLAIRFIEDNRIQYLLDINKYINTFKD